MPRRARKVAGGIIYHVLNRGCGKMKLFAREGDYAAFERLLVEAQQRVPMRILSYCLMPNHWHLVLWPEHDKDLSRFMFWLTMTHVQRWRHLRKLVGLGPLYQGRFRAFAVQDDGHFLNLCRYVERNALRAGLVRRAQDWRWSSLNVRSNDTDERGKMLSEWPVPPSPDWLRWVNQPQTDAEVEQIRLRLRTGRPLGALQWERQTAARLGINLEPAPRGRPKRVGH
ncbi:MAG TPA: transposase [Tepidisphaeraceae bacterium]|nr:transposase [Tepidisphaeraceae bacterium]